ncbi:methyltransferase [Leeia aquatica]|uniref:Methyltransferase domain-containing protein n=1 Tax=Leeia aquatica TaxID=2725557 RepID=A0A847SDY5_9NEIS|nr:methyltransferase [Leeia aquatica]NLR75499.1 methyltransferase domain-containing protein [Leeia aquatica]
MPQDSSQADFWNSRYQNGVTPWNAGGIPHEIAEFAHQHERGRVLIPGCGHGHEVQALAQGGHQVTAIDFSPDAVAAAQAVLGPLADCVHQADFFALNDPQGYDWIYERAFLCALPRSRWSDWGRGMQTLLKPGGYLAGYFFLADKPHGPPFGTDEATVQQLLGPGFERLACAQARYSLPVFSGQEYWMIWRRCA